MAKISRAQGPSIEPEPPVRIRRQMIGGDPSSSGNSSSQLSKNAQASETDANQSHQAPAQTTENRSDKVPETSSTAHSTGGAGHETQERKSVKKPPTKSTAKHAAPESKKARVRSTDEFNEFD